MRKNEPTSKYSLMTSLSYSVTDRLSGRYVWIVRKEQVCASLYERFLWESGRMRDHFVLYSGSVITCSGININLFLHRKVFAENLDLEDVLYG